MTLRHAVVATLLSLAPLPAFGQACESPSAPAISFVPPGNIGVGQTYVVVWSRPANLDAAGGFLVERSRSSSFSPVLDSQETMSTSASFLAPGEGTFFHRVRAIPACDPTRGSAHSPARSVTVVTGKPSVVFTIQPRAVITNLGEPLENQASTMTLENISGGPVTIAVTGNPIGTSNFFTLADPQGEDLNSLTLESRTPRTLQIRFFSGPPNGQAGAYQGVIFVVGLSGPLTITPYAFVNLKVGASPATQPPQFLVGGTLTEYTFFPGFPNDPNNLDHDASRLPISVEIRNPNPTPMELGAEIGPEVWLLPDAGWNATAIPPNASRTILFRTKRRQAPSSASALPRYTYFTVRSRTGETTRLLVQDNDSSAQSAGRSTLDATARSYVIPLVVREGSLATATTFSSVRLSNIGSERTDAELIFTPRGADGFDAGTVKRAVIVVPPNDVVALTDPLGQVFGLSGTIDGQIEVRAAPERIGSLNVISSISSRSGEGGLFSYPVPTAFRSEGATSALLHEVTGVSGTASIRADLVLAETSGRDAAAVRVTLIDASGTRRGETRVSLGRYGLQLLTGVISQLGGSSDGSHRIEIAVESGQGSVLPLARLVDPATGSGAIFAGQAAASSSGAQHLYAAQKVRWAATTTAVTVIVPTVVSTPPTTGDPFAYATRLGFSSPPGQVTTFMATFTNTAVTPPVQSMATITVQPRQMTEYSNVLQQLFRLSPSTPTHGPLFIEISPRGGQVTARLDATRPGVSLVSAVPVIPTSSEAVTGGSSSTQRPLYLDGLEQSVDSSRGTRWNLILTEVKGESLTVSVRLYEAGNRTLAIAEKEFVFGARQQRRLETVFAELGLDTAERKKDRTNVLCVVTATAGTGMVMAVAESIDNRTRDVRKYILGPNGGLPATVSLVTPVAPPPPPAGRRRAVRGQ